MPPLQAKNLGQFNSLNTYSNLSRLPKQKICSLWIPKASCQLTRGQTKPFCSLDRRMLLCKAFYCGNGSQIAIIRANNAMLQEMYLLYGDK